MKVKDIGFNKDVWVATEEFCDRDSYKDSDCVLISCGDARVNKQAVFEVISHDIYPCGFGSLFNLLIPVEFKSSSKYGFSTLTMLEVSVNYFESSEQFFFGSCKISIPEWYQTSDISYLALDICVDILNADLKSDSCEGFEQLRLTESL